MEQGEMIDTKDIEKVKGEEEETETPKPKETTYTQAEHDREISKSVEAAIAKREAKLEKEIEARIEKEKNEAVEYEKLTQKEKANADFEKRMEALTKREKEINNRELLSQIKTDLKENQLPASFADTLLTLQDNEKIKSTINGIKKDFDDAINERVKEALRQGSPEQSTKTGTISAMDAKIKKYM